MLVFPTSMRSLSIDGILVVAVVALVVGAAVGYLIHGTQSSSVAAEGSTLSITAAGTLSTLFPEVARAFANVTPGAEVPLAAEQFQGSLAALSQVSQLHDPFDVAAAADYRLIPSMLEPSFASFEVVFASTPEVLVYDPSVPAFAGINSTNWPSDLTASGIVLGVANQSIDPNGYNAIFTLELQGLLSDGGIGTLYGHFFTTPVGGLAEPNAGTTRVEPETQVASLIHGHEVSAFITYRSYAESQGLSYVNLDPRVNLGSTDNTDLTFYGNASTSILASSGGLETVHGAPVLFAATIPSTAPNPTLGAEFLEYLLSPAGSLLIAGAGFTPIFPAFSDQPTSALPGLLSPLAVPLPSPLASLLS
jgi:molybdate/tungstate transport system substrate-binding protein